MDWWTGRAEERYWCEVTDRDDLGGDLKCPQTNEKGGSFWSYELIREIQPGDLVFHYKDKALVGCSVAGGPWREQPIEWRAQGTTARSRPGPAESRPGWALPLSSFTPLQLSLEDIRREEPWIRAQLDKLPEPRKIPWSIQNGRLQGMQAYLAKFPAVFVLRWAKLARVTVQLGMPPFADAPISDAAQLTQIVALHRQLRRAGLMLEARGVDQPRRIQSTTTSWARLPSVVAHVLARAAGRCEACGIEAPFIANDGEPFLEVHHVRRLADGGPDRVDNAVALCPNCHRALHLAADREARQEHLYQRMHCLRRY